MQESLIHYCTGWTNQSLEIEMGAGELSSNGSSLLLQSCQRLVSHKRILITHPSHEHMPCPLFFSKSDVESEDWNTIISIKPLLLSGGWEGGSEIFT